MFRNEIGRCVLNRGPASSCMRLKFVEPLMPTLVEKPPEGGNWIHEVKFDGYRSQIVRDEDGVRIFTRRGLNWTRNTGISPRRLQSSGWKAPSSTVRSSC